jgi:hypothetical protein
MGGRAAAARHGERAGEETSEKDDAKTVEGRRHTVIVGPRPAAPDRSNRRFSSDISPGDGFLPAFIWAWWAVDG